MSKRKEPDEAVEARLTALAAEIEQRPKPDNSFRPLLTGWALWWRCTLLAGEGTGVTYRDPAFPACPKCNSPNVRLLRTRRNKPNRYWCLDCEKRDTCVVPLTSTGIERRKAQRKMLIITLVILAVQLALVLTGHGSWLGSGGG